MRLFREGKAPITQAELGIQVRTCYVVARALADLAADLWAVRADGGDTLADLSADLDRLGERVMHEAGIIELAVK